MIEARAKMLWGDSPAQVLGYLRGQGFSQEDAQSIVEELTAERIAEVRANGIKYLLGGIAAILVPVIAIVGFMHLGYFYVKTLLITLVIGCIGIWLVIKGTFMLLSPKEQGGDISEQ
jgi:hypothetical protein